MHFLDFLYLFFAGSIFGWFLELFYRRLFSAKKWINPGFLTGPWVPLYGFGLSGLYYLTERLSLVPIPVPWQKTLLSVFLCGVVMTLLEFFAGLIFIYGMKIQLWDYGNRPGNVMGLICPLFYLIWTAVAAIYILFLHEPLSELIAGKSTGVWEYFFIGIVCGVFCSDVVYSLTLSIRISGMAKDFKVVVQYEKLKSSILADIHRLEQKRNFLFAFKSEKGLKESMKAYAEELLEKLPMKKRKNKK